MCYNDHINKQEINMHTTLTQFTSFASEVIAATPSDKMALASDVIYNEFEYNTSDEVRAAVYSHSDVHSPEPFRAAMETLGFYI
jgi:hypothetical protein